MDNQQPIYNYNNVSNTEAMPTAETVIQRPSSVPTYNQPNNAINSNYQQSMNIPEAPQMQSTQPNQFTQPNYNSQVQSPNNQDNVEKTDIPEITLIKISDDYYETDKHDMFVARISGKRGRTYFREMTNFGILSLRKEIYADRDGNKIRYMNVLLLNDESQKKEIKLSYEGWTSHLMKLIEREAPGFIIFSDRFRNAAAMFN